jgi:hypothetical protein
VSVSYSSVPPYQVSYTKKGRIGRYLSLGLWALVVSVALSPVSKVFGLDIRLTVPSSLTLGMGVIIVGGLHARLTRASTLEPRAWALWQLILLWSLVTIVRGITPDKYGIYMWGGGVYAWAWAVPIVMPLGAHVGAWKVALRTSMTIAKIGVGFWLFGRFLIGVSGDLGMTRIGPFLVLFLVYLPSKWHKFVWAATTVAMMVAVLASNRNLLLAHGLTVLAGIWVSVFKHGYGSSRRRLNAAVFLSIAVISIWYVFSVDRIPFVGAKTNARIAEFKEELPKNTRQAGEHSIYSDFFRDVDGLDRFFGRGCMGTYLGWYSRGAVGWQDRRNIECGYLQMILKGGLVMLAFFLALAIPAAWKGLFNSRNWFVRGCALFVWIRLVEMVPYGIPNAEIRYVLFWMCVGCCWSRIMREATEADIAAWFVDLIPRRRTRRVWMHRA